VRSGGYDLLGVFMMDKMPAGLLGALAGIATMVAVTPASATPALAPATSYAELLGPIPNAVEVLRADDAQRTEQPASEVGGARVYDAEYYRRRHHHHHHHHHHNYYR
jgi:hypothetical protein